MTNERDDAMLTAYAVGELAGAELEAVEARLADDPPARAAVEEIRQVADLLEAELQGEAAPRLAASQPEAIAAAAAGGRPRRWLPIAAGLAAAAAVLVAAGIFFFRPKDDPQPSRRVAGQIKPPKGNGGDGPGVARGTPDPVDPGNGSKVPGDRVALKIALPPPIFDGTPTPIRNEPNMGPARKGKRPPFFAPKGTVNIARGKPVTSSDSEPIIGQLKMVTDGNKEGGSGYFVELAPGKQWLTIDLQKEATIYAIVVWHFHSGMRAYRDVVVQVSRDQDFIDCRTVFNNDHDNSSGHGKGKDKVYMEDYQGRLIDCKGIRGRYVRLWSRENTSNDESNHYIEVEVYGRTVK